MLQKYKTKREEGFTIIEVLIVLAIAGLIILIVFLAVPALQRNSRNTQRTNDASRFVAAFQECTNNNNGFGAPCFSGAVFDYIDLANNQQLNSINVNPNPGGPGLNAMYAYPAQTCNDEGNGVEPPGGNRKIMAVTYLIETNGGGTAVRCLDS